MSKRLVNEASRWDLDLSQIGFWGHDLRTGTLASDDRCRAIFGLPQETAVSYTVFLDRVHPDDRRRVDATIQGAAQGQGPGRAEFRTAGARDVEARWVSSTGAMSASDPTACTQLIGCVVDVTGRQPPPTRQQELFREREETGAVLDTLFQQAPVGFGFWDQELRFVRGNRALAEILDTPSGPLGDPSIPGWSLDAHPSVAAALAHVRKTQETFSHEISGSTASAPGFRRYWRVSYYPVKLGGRLLGVGAIWDESTEQRIAHQRLAEMHARGRAARTEAERLNRVKDEFLSTVSHELRAPLQSILGWVRTLRDGGLSTAQVAHGMRIIERNAYAQVHIIEDILDVSRIISGNLRIARQSVNLAPTVEFVLETIAPAALAKRIAVSASVPDDLEPIVADEERIKQVLWNLLSNAVKFTDSGGSVHISLRKVEAALEIRVEDTGRGIRAAFLPHVFERFRQQDAGTTRSQGGLGLGLAIVRHIVEMHGGTVSAESDGEGKGAAFVVRLPTVVMSDASTQKPPAREPASLNEKMSVPHPLDGVRILIAEDDPDARELLGLVLERNGAHATMVASAREALQAIESTTFDVMLSDIGMPGEDGYALSRALRGQERRPSVLLALTAYARKEDRRAAVEAGFDGHAAKPIEPAALVAKICELVEKSRASRT